MKELPGPGIDLSVDWAICPTTRQADGAMS